jgi:parallel beta-helix repeat protein
MRRSYPLPPSLSPSTLLRLLLTTAVLITAAASHSLLPSCARASGASATSDAPAAAQAVEVPVTNNMQIAVSTKLKPGTYTFGDPEADGVIKIVGDDVTVDATGVTLVSGDAQFRGFGVTASGRRNFALRGATVGGFRYGVRVENSSGVRIEDSTVAGNYKDTTTCFLQITAGETYGGGILFRNVTDSLVQGNRLYNQSTGVELIDSSNNRVLDNQTSLGPAANEAQQNSCWGIRLQNSGNNLIRGNVADYVNRERYPCTAQCQAAGICGACRAPASGTCLIPGDSAGILLTTGSHANRVVSNSFTNSGDGFFIGNYFSLASNDNYVYGNDGSYAPANAFEATFSHGNVFENNDASNSNYGFWLGYSYRSRVTANRITGNHTVGIEIEQGYENEIDRNRLAANLYGIYLRADAACSTPVCDRNNPTDECGKRCPSSDYSVHGNTFENNTRFGLWAGGFSFDMEAWHNDLLCGTRGQPCEFSVNDDMTRERGIMATRNWWGTTAPAQIAAAVLDHDDDPSRGVVNTDFPLYAPAEPSVSPRVMSWAQTAPLPVASSAPFDRRGQQLVFYKNRVYVFGGRTTSDTPLRNVYYGDLLPDGRVRAWTRTTDLPGAFYDHVVVRVGADVYLLTGAAGSDAVYHNRITPGGALGPAWELERARLPSRQSFAAAASGEYIYAVGGNSGGLINSIRFIRVLPDGHLECTAPDPAQCFRETEGLPLPTQSHSVVIYESRLYVITTDGRFFHVPLNPDGTIPPAAWGEFARVPRPLGSFAAFATDGKLYLLAGSGSPSVYFTQLGPNGAAGPWQTTLDLPPAALVAGARVGAEGDYVYTLGGFDGTADRKYVFVGRLEVPGGCRDGENLDAPFTSGLNGARSQLTYRGLATITVSGVGQASAQNYSDAFYVFAGAAGNPVTPTHTNEFALTINGRPAHDFIARRAVPAYRLDHRYTFRVNAPQGPLTFGVGDGFTSDNTGAYRVGLCGGTP